MLFKCKWVLLLASIIFISGCASNLNRASFPNTKKKKTQVIAPNKMPSQQPLVCDMHIQIKITDPIDPLMWTDGKVTVYGKNYFKITKTFPVKLGVQVITIPDLKQDRYNVEVSYGNYIATKCVLLGCVCEDNWKETFMQDLARDWHRKNELRKSQQEYQQSFGNGFGAYSSGTIGNAGLQEPPCSEVTICNRNVEFEFPKDTQ